MQFAGRKRTTRRHKLDGNDSRFQRLPQSASIITTTSDPSHIARSMYGLAEQRMGNSLEDNFEGMQSTRMPTSSYHFHERAHSLAKDAGSQRNSIGCGEDDASIYLMTPAATQRSVDEHVKQKIAHSQPQGEKTLRFANSPLSLWEISQHAALESSPAKTKIHPRNGLTFTSRR